MAAQCRYILHSHPLIIHNRKLLELEISTLWYRVGLLPWQKVFLPGQWKKPVKTGNNWQKVQYIN